MHELFSYYKPEALVGVLPNGIEIMIFDQETGWEGDDVDEDLWEVKTGVLDLKAIFQPMLSIRDVDCEVFYLGEPYNGGSLEDL